MSRRDSVHALDGRQVVIRPAHRRDSDAIVRIWTTGWRDAHEGHVPAELVAARSPDAFRAHIAERITETTVVLVDGGIAGFVTVVGDEVEQLYVDRPWRGSGVAVALLTEAERRISDAGYDHAWLAVVAGNARARSFYGRAGWLDDGEAAYAAFAASGGSPVSVLVRRYVKDLEVGPKGAVLEQPHTHLERSPMRDVILYMSMSLDGFVDSDRAHPGMAVPEGAELAQWKLDHISKAGAHLMGRVTYQQMSSYWPHSDDPYATPMNDIPKVVFSTTLTDAEATWPVTRVARGDLTAEIAAIKSEPGPDVVAWGGGRFAGALAAADLIDEYRLLVQPLVVGQGQALFDQLPGARHLDLVEASSFPTGVVVHVYRRKNA